MGGCGIGRFDLRSPSSILIPVADPVDGRPAVNHAAASLPMPPRVLDAHVMKAKSLASHAAVLALLVVASA